MAIREIVKTGTYGMVRSGQPTSPIETAKLVQTAPPSDLVMLTTGEYVPMADFSVLSEAEQAYLRKFGVAAFNEEQAKVSEQRAKRIEPYKSGEGYDVVAMVQAGHTPEALRKLGFREAGITEAQGVATELRAIEVELGKLTPEQQAEVKATGSYTIKESKDEILNRIHTEKPWASNITYNEATGEVTYTLPDPVAYLQTHAGDTQALVNMGHDASTVNEINKALLDTKDFWNKDGSFQGDKYLRLYSNGDGDLRILGFTEGQITQIKAYNDQPLSKEAFVQMYFDDRDWKYSSVITRAIKAPLGVFDWTGYKQENERYSEATAAYIKKYGMKEAAKSSAIEAAAMALPALRALHPEVKLSDITVTEWAFTGLVPLTLATGAIGGIAGAGVSSVVLKATSTLAGAGLTSLMGYETVKNWGTMTAAERTIMVAFTALAAFGSVAEGIGTVKAIKSYRAVSPTLKAATVAGQGYKTMVKTTNAVKAKLSQSNLTKLEKATKASVAADLKFLDKFSDLKQVTSKQLSKIETLSRMPGLKKATLNLVKNQKLFETTLNSMKKTPITPAEAAKLATVRESYFKALDKFTDIAQPRYMGWRVPLPERFVIETEGTPLVIAKSLQSEWDAVTAKLRKTEKGSPEYMRLIDKQEAMVRRSYEILSKGQDVSPEVLELINEINRYHKERIEISPEPLTSGGGTKTRLALAEMVKVENPLPDVVLTKEEVKAIETKTKITKEAAVEATPTKAPKVATGSAFPGITSKVRVTTSTGTTTADATELARMTPDSLRRLYGGEVRIIAIGKPMPGTIKAGQQEWLSPDQAVKEAQQIVADSTIQDMVRTFERLYNQGATQDRIEQKLYERLQSVTQTVTSTSLRQALRTQLQTTTETTTDRGLRNEIRTTIERIIRGIPFFHIGGAASTTKKKREKYPDGTVVWKMGELKRGGEWKIIPPPYNLTKPISSTKPPIGVSRLTGTPQQTLTFIGGKLPFKNVSFDLGITDGFIDVKNKKIEFTGHGLETNVGARIAGSTKGMSIPAVFPVRFVGQRPKSRQFVPRRPKSRHLAKTVSIGR